jgi:hypothetical protein
MNRSISVVGVLAAVAGMALLSKPRRDRIGNFMAHRMLHHMEQMMASLPETSPPRLVMSTLPRLREQNEQILEMLVEQNALLREHLRRR